VSIGERRAKFRVDLVSGKRPEDDKKGTEKKFHRYQSDLPEMMEKQIANSQARRQDQRSRTGIRSESIATTDFTPGSFPEAEKSKNPKQERKTLRRRFSEVRRTQDILEVWFSGNHGDIGGGWHRHESETWPLAHAPLVWMIKEAQEAGLKFDADKLAALYCSPERFDDYGQKDEEHPAKYQKALDDSALRGFVHDCLEYGKGPKKIGTFGWNLMENLPFRRMDLQPNGEWKPIRWPLPKGETRDIPADAKIHVSVLRRMEADEEYRPGNLIGLGEGGRGQLVAPKELGMGEWVSWSGDENTKVEQGEVWVSKRFALEKGMHEVIARGVRGPHADEGHTLGAANGRV
jgi:hypothetical protein